MKRPAVLLSLAVVLVLAVLSLGLMAFAYSGAANVAASEDYLPGVKWFFDTVSTNSIKAHAEASVQRGEISEPAQVTDAMLRKGASEYQAMCVPCHGTPGGSRGEFGRGMKPEPPDLAHTAREMERREVFWVAHHGSFEEAIARDPGYAAAHAGLADSYIFLCVYGQCSRNDVLPKTEAALSRALALDPMLGEAYASLGGYRVVQFDLRGAEAAFSRALELNPGDHRSRHWHAMALSCLGRHDDALAEIEQALELDPFGVTVNQDAGRILYGAGRYEEAIVRLRHTLAIAPHARWAPAFLTFTLIRTGNLEGALAAASSNAVLHAFVRGCMGERDAARNLLGTTIPALSFTSQGLLHLALGQVEEGLALFKRGAERLDLDALDLYPGFRPFVEDHGLRAELDVSFQTVHRAT